MRILLWILLGCAALLLLLLLLPVRLRFLCARGQTRLTLRVLGIPIRLLPRKEKKPKHAPKHSAEAEKPAEEPAKPPKKENPLRRLFAGKSLPEQISLGGRLLRLTVRRAGWILRRIRFSGIRLSLTVSGEDAAAVALRYGQVCAVFYPLLSFLQAELRFHPRKVDLRADFAGGKSDLRASGTLCLRPITLLAAGIALLIQAAYLIKSEEQQ